MGKLAQMMQKMLNSGIFVAGFCLNCTANGSAIRFETRDHLVIGF